MARTARSLHARKKRKKVLEQAKGYRGTKKSSYKRAKEQVWKGGVYAYAGRKQRKRDFRALWIQRINAGAREHGLSYSQFINGLRLAEVDLDRKILADLAATEPTAFAAVVQEAKDALNGGSGEKQARQRRAQGNGAGGPSRGDEVEATEAAERKANELDVDLAEVEGSGSEGRVLVEDVEEAGGEISATDAARSKADELEVDLAAVEGTGANERITVGDVENAAEGEGGKAE
jgi:large subunit ribosomal protein L20